MSEHGIPEPQGHLQCRLEDLRKTRVVSRGEGQLAPQAIAPGRPAQRTFGGNVDGLRGQCIQLACELGIGPHRQINLVIPRTRPGAEQPRMDHRHLMVQRIHLTHKFHQCSHHAVDLRLPGIGNQSQFHATTPIGCGADGSRDWLLSTSSQ